MIANAMAREIVVGKNGKVEAVSYIDKATRSEQRVYAKACCGGGQCLRIRAPAAEFALPSFPNGLANSSGVVGRYLTDSVGSRPGRVLSATRKHAGAQP